MFTKHTLARMSNLTGHAWTVENDQNILNISKLAYILPDIAEVTSIACMHLTQKAIIINTSRHT